MSMEIKLVDNDATNAWDAAGLETFDPNSELADEIDADDDGSITQLEIENYQQSKANSTEESNTAYSVVSIDAVPDDYKAMEDILNKSMTSFEEMTVYIENIVSENESVIAQIESLSSETSPAEAKGAANKSSQIQSLSSKITENANSLTKVSTDIETTDSSVDKVMEKVKKSNENLLQTIGASVSTAMGIGGIAGGITLAIIGASTLGIVLPLTIGVASLTLGILGLTAGGQQGGLEDLGQKAIEKGEETKNAADEAENEAKNAADLAQKTEEPLNSEENTTDAATDITTDTTDDPKKKKNS